MEIPVKPDHVLTCEETEWMARPLVYIRRRVRDGKALYIGASSSGLGRPLSSLHEKAKLEDGEILEVYLAEDPFELEVLLILHEQPTLNVITHYTGARSSNQECGYCEKPFQSKGKKALFCSPSCRFKAWDRRNPRVKAACV